MVMQFLRIDKINKLAYLILLKSKRREIVKQKERIKRVKRRIPLPRKTGGAHKKKKGRASYNRKRDKQIVILDD
jgi:hypothetical protein